MVVVPAAGVDAVPELCTLGSATAPPPAGSPLRSVALPTFPVVGVALCARAVETSPNHRKKANPQLRIITRVTLGVTKSSRRNAPTPTLPRKQGRA